LRQQFPPHAIVVASWAEQGESRRTIESRQRGKGSRDGAIVDLPDCSVRIAVHLVRLDQGLMSPSQMRI
jgi:hypothetical protein